MYLVAHAGCALGPGQFLYNSRRRLVYCSSIGSEKRGAESAEAWDLLEEASAEKEVLAWISIGI